LLLSDEWVSLRVVVGVWMVTGLKLALGVSRSNWKRTVYDENIFLAHWKKEKSLWLDVIPS
jgi:hypothetical protein